MTTAIGKWSLLVAAVILLACAPLLVSDYYLSVAIIAFYYVVLAASWNFIAGTAGQYSLATPAFAAIGAYASGLSIYYFNVPIPVDILFAAGVAGFCGLILGMLVLGLRDVYLAISTWAFGATVFMTLRGADAITRGDLGLSVPSLLGNSDPAQYYWVFLGLTVGSLGLIYVVLRSRAGWILRSIRDNQMRARTIGINTTRWKLFAFVLSSSLAGLAGAFYGHYVLVISPRLADFLEMARIIVMVSLGGFGSWAGPLVGAPLVTFVSDNFASYGAWNNVLFAAVVILLMRTFREGLGPLVVHVSRAAVKVVARMSADHAVH